MRRMSKDAYYMSLAILASKRSTCVRRQVGCVAVKNNHVVATGYNGAVAHTEHCTNETCYRKVNNIPSGEKLDICKAVHAEQNIICQAASHGIDISGSTIYINTSPCVTCLKLLAQIDVRRIVVLNMNYTHTDISKDLCDQLGITFETPWSDYDINTFTLLSVIGSN